MSGVYLFMAILCAVQEAGAWRIPLERSLRRQESQYRAMVENMTEGLMWLEAVSEQSGQAPLGLLVMRERAVNEKNGVRS